MNRRQFINQSALASTSLFIPQFLKAFENAPAPLQFGKTSSNGKTLVIIQLSGGNDGLNTIVPYENDAYYRARPTLGIHKNKVIRLNDQQGLNPALAPLQSLYDQGMMSVLNSVGYPNPNRSHFRSMDIWQSGSGANQYLNTGWLGRYLDANCSGACAMHQALEIDSTLSLAMKGEAQKGMAVKQINKLYKATKQPIVADIAAASDHHESEQVSYLYKTVAETVSSAAYIREKAKIHRSTTTYPKGQLAKSLQIVAELIAADINTNVFYVSQTGYDTHIAQNIAQTRLLTEYGKAVSAFMADLKSTGKADDVLVMTFSEFGRRVKQNASNGTDHGAANNIFLMGGGLKQQGILNDAPDLVNLADGDLRYTLDFRSVYATILQNWLGTNPQTVLGGRFPLLGFV